MGACFTGFALASRMMEVRWVPLPVKVIQQAFIAMDKDHWGLKKVCVCCILCGSWRMTSSRQDSFSLMFSAWAVFFQPRHTWPTISWDISPLHGVVISFWHLPQVISLRKGLLSAQLLVSPSHSEAGCYCHTSKHPRAYIISETLPLDWFG